ncbi:uncharacterized protein [Miscanthus floridulus]|uniref:uncharacterized protein n=1 Tax=Miscanthus floridulus TaxID=154761 RepID=UPI003458887C
MPGTPPPSPKSAAAAASKAVVPTVSSLDSDAQAKAAAVAKAAADADAAACLRAANRKAEHDAALARAAAAEKEAQAAALERAVAAARARDALAHADAGAPADGDDEDDLSDHASNHNDNTDLHQALLLQEAAAITNLHSQAVAVQNIRNLVTVVLDLNAGNFNRWRDQFLLIVGKYSLQHHVLQDLPAPGFPNWQCMDCVVKSWILCTISDDLAATISAHNSTARDTWRVVESQFFNNRETRALLLLDAKLRNFVQGDLSITDYCKELKRMADTLGDLGEVVTDHTLVLNLIRGLNEHFKTVGMHLRRGRPFPMFLDMKADLLLVELMIENTSSSQLTTLTASTTTLAPSRPPTVKQPAASSAGSGGGSAPSNNRRGKCDGWRDGAGGNPAPTSTQPGAQSSAPFGGQLKPSSSGSGGTPWPSFYRPWAGAIQMWPGP